MNIKLYTQTNCLYCKQVKDKLDEFHISYESVDISLEENRVSWNSVVKVSGLPMTPTITMGKEIWAPNRDFRSPEELANRLKEVQKTGGIEPITKEEEFYVLLNGMKNLGIGMRSLQTQITQLQTKLSPPTQSPPTQSPPTQSPPTLKPIEPVVKTQETTN